LEPHAIACPKCRADWSCREYQVMTVAMTKSRLHWRDVHRQLERDRHDEVARQRAAPPPVVALTAPDFQCWLCCPHVDVQRRRHTNQIHFEDTSDRYMEFSVMGTRGICSCAVCGRTLDVVGSNREETFLTRWPIGDWPYCDWCEAPRGIMTDVRAGERWWVCLHPPRRLNEQATVNTYCHRLLTSVERVESEPPHHAARTLERNRTGSTVWD
jgi:hypothetical protein